VEPGVVVVGEERTGEDESEDETAVEAPDPAASPAGTDDLKAAWERVMNRMRTDSPRLCGILKEVQAFSRSGKHLKLFVRKGHSFAMDTLRKEPPQLMTALEQEMGAKLSLVVAEDATAAPPSTEGAPAPSAAPERGWIEKKAVKSRAVQSVVSQLDGEIIRVD
jgi:hypothetical protein